MSAADTPGGSGERPIGPVDASRDARIIADLRTNRARQNAREMDDQWSMRLTFGEIDALLRIADERDDLKRRLIGEWEGDIPEPMTVVETRAHLGTLGEEVTWREHDRRCDMPDVGYCAVPACACWCHKSNPA